MLGENIKNMRTKLGFSQAYVADYLHVTRQTVSSWEINRTEPTMGNIEALARLFGCKKSDLIDGNNAPVNIDLVFKNDDLYHLIEIAKDMDENQLKRMLAYFEYFRDHKI